MKKKFIVIFTLLSLLLVALPVSADTSPIKGVSEEEIDSKLLENGYPQEYIDSIELEQKRIFYETDSEFVSTHVYTENLTETVADPLLREAIQDAFDSALADVSPYAINNFTHTLTVSRLTSTKANTARYSLSYNWTYDGRFTFNLTDKFGIAWSDDWDLVNDSARYGYRPYGVNSNGNSCTTSWSWSGQDDYDPGAGIGWKYDVKHNFTVNGVYCESNKHTGWGYAEIVQAHDNSGDLVSSSAAAKYFHRYGTANGTISFSNSPSLDISWSWMYDISDAAAKQWYWTKTTLI